MWLFVWIHDKCFPTQELNSHQRHSTLKLCLFYFPSFSLLKLTQNMSNKALNSAHISRKSCDDFHTPCHDLQFVHNTKWPLSTKFLSLFNSDNRHKGTRGAYKMNSPLSTKFCQYTKGKDWILNHLLKRSKSFTTYTDPWLIASIHILFQKNLTTNNVIIMCQMPSQSTL